jgi:methyl-accepting chemotaxis protein
LDEKKTFKQKIKEFFKKYWHIIASFIAGISASVFYFLRISGRSGNRNPDFGNELEHLTVGLEGAEDGLSELADNNEQARELTAKQRETLTDIGNRYTDIEDTSAEIGNSIQRIKQLIEAERKRVESTEDKD